jgi:hypothetical protein
VTLSQRRFDRVVFSLTNAWFYLTRPLFVLRYHRKLGRWPKLATPGRLSELVQWRKLFDRNPAFIIFADKLATKTWIAERLPDLPMAETLWVGDRPEDIPAALLTPGHVIKTNNASGQNYLPHRGELPRAEVNRQFHRWLRASAGKRWLGWLDQGQEWAYWPVPSKVFVERQVSGDRPLVDISVRVLDGEALMVSCALDFKTEGSTVGYFWPDGTPVDDPEASTLPTGFAVPPAFFEAVRAAAILGQGFDYLRIDFLTDGDTLYSGEITCYPASGHGTDDPFIRRLYLRWLDTLHLSWALSTPQPWPRRVYLAAFRRWLDRHRAELARNASPEKRE